MKIRNGLLLMMLLVFVGLSGYGLRSTSAQNSTIGETQAVLPADIHPDTLSRMPRTKREDLTTDEDRQAYDWTINNRPQQLTQRWLGPTGTRLQFPVIAKNYNQQIGFIHELTGGLTPAYAELAISVATHELNNQEEFLDHEADRLKFLGAKIDEILVKDEEPTGLEPKQAIIIRYGRELFRESKVSSKTFAEMEKSFGRVGTLHITLYMCYYLQNGLLVSRAYDQHLDTRPECFGHDTGCISANHPVPWTFLKAGYDPLKHLSPPLSLTEKLPADIHSDTLSRMPRATRDEFTTDAEKAAYDRLYGSYTKLQVSKWLGPTGTRIHMPQLAETYQAQLKLLREAGLGEKYYEMAVAVALRETDNKEEWLNHETDRMKLLGPKVEETLRKNMPPTGLEEKEAAMTRFGREMFRNVTVSAKTFAEMEQTFGRKNTLLATLVMGYYASNALLMRAYDQHMDTSASCSTYHSGCLTAKNVHNAW